MAGMTRLYASDIGRAAVEAFKAGDDLLIIPPDIDAAYRSMLQAAKSGELSAAQIDTSVLKILNAKASVGLNKARLVNLDAISKEVGRPENVARGQQIADDAVTLVRDNGKLLPLKQMGTVNGSLPYQRVQEVRNKLVVVILSEDVRSESGRMLERQILARVPDANVLYVDPRVANAMSEDVMKAVQEAQAVVAAVYVIPTAGRALKGNGGLVNSVSMADATGALLNNILSRAAEKTMVLAMGNPYVAADFPAVQNYICAFSNVPVSETSVAKALFGEMAIHGHLPVSIPGIAQRGSGIEREPAVAQGELRK
jgi:beta-N-acetylhexosaminidase